MKNIVSLFLLAVCTIASIQGQQLKTVENSLRQAVISFESAAPVVSTVNLGGTLYDRVSIPQCGTSQQAGQPQLPVYRRLIEIPVCDSIEVVVTQCDRQTLSAADLGISHPLIPIQPHRRKNDTVQHLVIDAAALVADTFFGSTLVSIEPLGIARSRRLALLSIAPLAYNPARQQFFFTKHADIVLRYHNADSKATQLLANHQSVAMPAPQGLIPLTVKASKASRQAPLRYVVIAHPMYRGLFDDFANWKRRQGFETDVVYLDDPEVGVTRESIRAYLKRQYTSATATRPAPSYVLLAGEYGQLQPFFTRVTDNTITGDIAHITDLYFFTWTDDNLPDCLYGRLSASTPELMRNQIDKILYYEQYSFDDPSYLGRAILTAGYDGKTAGDYAYTNCDPSMDYAASNYITAANGYHTVYYYKNNTTLVPTGVTVSGSSHTTDAQSTLLRHYSEGAGWINYSGHGTERGWSGPQFNVNQVASMANYDKPSVMIGNCCLTNRFSTSTCFGEALLQRGNRAGAAAYIGASNSTFWDDDFYWSVGFRNAISPEMHVPTARYDANHVGMYDRLFHQHGEPSGIHATSMGAMIQAGDMAVMSEGLADYSLYYWEIYHLLGDPSMQPWLGEAQPLNMQVSSPVSRSTGTVVVITEPFARIALTTDDNQLVDAVFADAEGSAILHFDPYMADSVLHVTGTAQNRIPAQNLLSLSNDAAIHLGITSLQVNRCIAGDTASLSFGLVNLSTDTLRYINYLLRGDPQLITPLHTNEYIHQLAPAHSSQQSMVCHTLIAPSVADQTEIVASLQFIADTLVVRLPVRMIVQAPVLSITRIDTRGTVAPGAAIDVLLTIANHGHATSRPFSCSITQPFGLAHSSDQQTVDALAPDSSATIRFSITLDSLCLRLRELPLLLTAHFGTHDIELPTIMPFYSDDFSTADFSRLAWRNTAEYPWQISSSAALSGAYAACSFRPLANGQSSSLALSFRSLGTDSVSFYYRVASEPDNDLFIATLDDITLLNASGHTGLWQHLSAPVDSGSHTLVFTYQKDMSRSVDSDCVWLDALRLPDTTSLVTHFYADTVCRDEPYPFFDQQADTRQAGVQLLSHINGDTLTLLRLSVVASPALAITVSDSAVLPGQSAFLTATGAVSYRWNTGDTTPSIIVSPSGPTTYTVVGITAGCSTADSVPLDIRPLTIETLSPLSPARLYPNPTRALLTIEAPDMQQVTLFDLRGRQILLLAPHAAKTQIDLSPLPHGIYLLRIATPHGTTTPKVSRQ
ncbi:MAG: T9SS type A sorting domain-containing protein [Bacteroidales bacterium]|nr:T9SS type A sorting domain-containing protein [Bacteroidales bacterium]